eukprot:TRINITY_DN2146_c0_g1_i1.p1 TRINITY_DN2146_c0_g1~~TRINITY_DN2146_c0_g1_i1.p1  ORF type:complete len:177 (-),score=56.42 TRINITY_DN2146_c0_g1_i1:224-754(-)
MDSNPIPSSTTNTTESTTPPPSTSSTTATTQPENSNGTNSSDTNDNNNKETTRTNTETSTTNINGESSEQTSTTQDSDQPQPSGESSEAGASAENDQTKQIDRILRPNFKYYNLNPYEVLNINPSTANEEEVKKAYRRISLLIHPDKAPEALRERAQTAFEELNKAYNMLKDPNEV